MAVSSSTSGVWFPQWAEVLAKASLKDLERRAYYRAIVEYLRFCKQSRQRTTVASARMFMVQVDARRLGASQMATWKAALNWFFRAAASGGARSSQLPKPCARKKEQFHEVCRFRHVAVRTEESYWVYIYER